MKTHCKRLNTRKVIQKKRQELMIGRISLKECFEGGGRRWNRGRRQKILAMVLTIVRNSGRMSRPTVGIIR